MATNPYTNFYSYGREQDLIEDLIIEAIRMYGHTIKYLPRTLVYRDDLWGEDTLSTFNLAADVEVYIKNVDAFEGDGDVLSLAGFEIRDSMTFTIAKKRFEAIKDEKILFETGANIVLEDGSTTTPSRQRLANSLNTDYLQLSSANAYSINSERPLEGDLLYFPMVAKLFEIKFVEHEAIFYQTGRLQTYDLRCELFEYSSERIDVSNTVIDGIEDEYSLDVLFNEALTEANNNIQLEDDSGSIVLEVSPDSVDRLANNEYFETESREILDFSEDNPFGSY